MFPYNKLLSFENALNIQMTGESRFCFHIDVIGLNGSAYGSAILWGYGAGTTTRYHYQSFGNVSVSINNKTFTITCSAQVKSCRLSETIGENRNFSITTS